MSRTEGSGASRGGGEEFHNEDAFLVDEGLGLYVVCDGLGSRPAGELASQTAIEALEEFVAGVESDDLATLIADGGASTRVVGQAIRHAIGRVVDASRENPELEGMATTVTLLLALGDQGVVGHLGDSRAALIRGGRFHRLTTDHDLTSAIDASDPGELPIETFVVELRADDVLILHTDGADEGLDDLAWARLASASPALLASRIVSAAHRRRPDLDATVVVARVLPDAHRAWLSLSEAPREYEYGHRVAVA